MNGFWVFAYGSLMWEPDFPHAEAQPALLAGYHRSLCIFSTVYRGTEDCPGLVLGLDHGGSCRGRALRVRDRDGAAVKEYLWRRELDTEAYRPKWLPVRLPDRRVTALCFVVNRANPNQYAGKLAAGRMAEMIRLGHGRRGGAFAYLENTLAHMDSLGIKEGALHQILALARDSSFERQ